MKKYIILALGLTAAVALNIHFRAFPAYFPQLKEQARAIVENRVYAQAGMAVGKTFPGFSYPVRKRLIEGFVSQYRKENKATLKNDIKAQYQRLKDKYQDPSGQTYLMELDCWHWGRYVDNILTYGHPGDKVIAGRQWDKLMLAPEGAYLPRDTFLFYLSAGLYKVFSLVSPLPLFTFLFYLPLFYTAILIIVIYLFCFYRWGNIAAWIASLSVGLSTIFLYRSCAGWFDKDVFHFIFPFLIIWAYVRVYEKGPFKERLFWLFVSAFLVGLFSFSWAGWWFTFAIIIIYELYSLVNLGAAYLQYKIKDRDSFREHSINLAALIIFSSFWVLVFCGPASIKQFYFQLKGALTLNQPLSANVWPNVYATVGELRKANFKDMTSALGGAGIFLISLLSLVALFFYTLLKRKDKAQKSLIMILIFWFLGISFACFKGVRFTMFLTLPLGISLGWMSQELYNHYKVKNKRVTVITTALLLVILSLRLLTNANFTARRIFPLMQDSWYHLLTNIRDNIPKEAVINAWWDFGDWFKVAAKRKVIFDGQSQNTPRSYWMARAFVSESEEEAVNILRMLNNSGNQAFEEINMALGDPYRSVLLLKKALASKEEQAKEILISALPAETAEKVLKMLFDRPGPAYFIMDYSMPDKMSQISYLGNWDFARSYAAGNIYNKNKPGIEKYLIKIGLDDKEAHRLWEEVALLSRQDLNSWISRRLGVLNRPVKGKEKQDMVFFDNGLLYNKKDNSVLVYSPQDYQYKTPFSLFLAEGEKLTEIIYGQAGLGYSVLIIRNNSGYSAVFLDRDLMRSLFSRIYFLNARGLKHFKPFAEERIGDSYIRVFEIVW